MGGATNALTTLAGQFKNKDVNWEALLRRNYLLLLDKGANVVDAGANRGLHSKEFVVELKCTNLAMFEAVPNLYKLLADDPIFANARIFCTALGIENKQATFYLKPNLLGESSLARLGYYGNGRDDDIEEITVQVSRLDAVEIGFLPDYIKIDVEGGEMDVLFGAKDVIERSRPIISTEYGPRGFSAFGYSKNSLYDWAAKFDYAVFDLLGNSLMEKADYDYCVGRYYWDYLILPIEKLDALKPRLLKVRDAALDPPLRAAAH